MEMRVVSVLMQESGHRGSPVTEIEWVWKEAICTTMNQKKW